MRHPKGYAYLEFAEAEAVEKAVEEKNDLELNGRPVKVACRRPNARIAVNIVKQGFSEENKHSRYGSRSS